MTDAPTPTSLESFFKDALADRDPILAEAIRNELDRQQNQIELIASENIVSAAVMEAQGSVMTNKYAEGYPGRRYYGGCEFVDVAENLARDRLKELFGCAWANVQPHSGAQANQAVMLATLKPGATILGMDLAHGGHLTHGSPVNLSGKWFNAVTYQVRKQDALIDYDDVAAKAHEHKPEMIIAGASAYGRHIDWAKFREIADEVGAVFHVDMAHYAGLIASGLYPSPVPHAHVCTSTTHKTLRGPRGGIIIGNDPAIGKKINSAVFPGHQGGPLMHVIAAKAVAFGEALKPEFKDYCQAVIDNSQVLAETLLKGGLEIVSGGTDSHLMLVDLRPKGVTGADAEVTLEHACLTCNKNSVPFDPAKPMVTSGIRLGTPAGTTRGFGKDEFRKIGELILECLEGLAVNGLEGNGEVEACVRAKTHELCKAFPIYS